VQTLLDGIKSALPNTEVVYSLGATATDSRWPESEILPEPPAGNDAAMIADAVAKAADCDAVIVGVGDAERTIGEGKSRTSLDLPGFQNDLVQALAKTGKPVIVVLMTGRAASINWIDRHCPAILEAWFPGEAGGRAIADVLFGDVNPSGKLPVTFPRTTGQLPLNFPYKPASETYSTTRPTTRASFIDTPLYTFGYGLSYTTFAYSNLVLSAKSIKPSESLTITATIKNTGPRAGEEIVQLYLQQTTSTVTTYEHILRGFQRISLQPRESKTITFTLPAQAAEIFDSHQNHFTTEPGLYRIAIAAASTDLRLQDTFTISNP
jgi:beta-glucosidase